MYHPIETITKQRLYIVPVYFLIPLLLKKLLQHKWISYIVQILNQFFL